MAASGLGLEPQGMRVKSEGENPVLTLFFLEMNNPTVFINYLEKER